MRGFWKIISKTSRGLKRYLIHAEARKEAAPSQSFSSYHVSAQGGNLEKTASRHHITVLTGSLSL
jgi:hypothetical protein